MNDDCLQSIVGATRRSAIVGGGSASSDRVLPLPPPPPASVWREIGPQFPPKARPGGPQQPSCPPPDAILAKHEMKSEPSDPGETIIDDLDVGWTFVVEPEAPGLNAPDRPEFVKCVKDWLHNNLSTAEFASLLN